MPDGGAIRQPLFSSVNALAVSAARDLVEQGDQGGAPSDGKDGQPRGWPLAFVRLAKHCGKNMRQRGLCDNTRLQTQQPFGY
jgi:hypothetical protein